MKIIKTILMMLMTQFAINVNAAQVGYKFPTDGSFTNESDGYYKTWVSSDGVLKIEGDSNWSFYQTSSTSKWTYIYKANYTISVTSGSTIQEYALASPHGGTVDITFTPANGNASTIPTWDATQKNYGDNIKVTDINAASTTFTVNGEGDYPYFSVYADYFVITVDKGESADTGGGSGEGTEKETKQYTFTSDGTFSGATTYEGYEYYKTWTSNDGNLTITGDNNYNFMKSGSWYYFLEGKFTVTANGEIKSFRIGYPSGSNISGGTFTDADGNEFTIPVNSDNNTYGPTINISDINAASTTFTITGTFSVYDGYAYFNAEVGGGQNTNPDDNQPKSYTFSTDGTLNGEYEYEGYTYYTSWTSSDGNITITNSDTYAFTKSGSWFYLMPGTFTISSKGQLQSYNIYYPIGSSTEGGTFTDAQDNSYTIPQYTDSNYGPDISVSGINASSTTFTITGSMAIADGYLTITATGGQGSTKPDEDTKQKKEITFSSGGTFSDATSAPDGSQYYKTWTSSDGLLTITGPNEYSFYGPDDDNIITMEPGEYTVTVSGEKTTLSSFEIQYLSGIESASKFTDFRGNVTDLPANPDKKTFSENPVSVKDINSTSTTFTVGGTGMYISEGSAKFIIETAGKSDNQGEQDDDSDYITYTLSQGSLKTPFVDTSGKSWDNYSTSWTSDDGVVTLKSTKAMSNGEPAWIFQINGQSKYMRANDSQYEVETAEGYQFKYLQISYPVSWYAESTLKFGTTEWVLPANDSNQSNNERYYPDPYYMNIDQPSFTISGASNARIWVNDDNFTIYLVKGDNTGIRNTVIERADKDVIYDLQGRRVLNPTKGIYIVNGKKVIKR